MSAADMSNRTQEQIDAAAAAMMHDLGDARRASLPLEGQRVQVDLEALERSRRINQRGTPEYRARGQRQAQLSAWGDFARQHAGDQEDAELGFNAGQSHRARMVANLRSEPVGGGSPGRGGPSARGGHFGGGASGRGGHRGRGNDRGGGRAVTRDESRVTGAFVFGGEQPSGDARLASEGYPARGNWIGRGTSGGSAAQPMGRGSAFLASQSTYPRSDENARVGPSVATAPQAHADPSPKSIQPLKKVAMSQDAQYFTPQQTVRETLMGTQAFVPTRPTGVDPQKCFSPHSVSSAYQLASPETFLRFHERNFPRKARAATSNVSSDDQQQTLPQRIAPQAVATPTNVSRKGKEKAPPEMAASQEEKLRIYPALTPTVSATARLESLLDFGLQQGLPEQAQSPQTGDLLSWEMSPLKPSKGIKEENVADTHGHGRSLSTLADEFADLSLKGKAVKDAVTRGVSMGSNVTSEGLQAETSVSGLPAASRTMAPVPTRRADRATLAAPATPTKPSVSATKPTPAPQATVAKPAAPKQPKALAGDLTKSRWAS